MKYSHVKSCRGFTAAEMLVATMIAAVVTGAAALCFAGLSRSTRHYTDVATVSIGTTAANAFYGLSTGTVTSYMAPNFGRVAQAEALRELFIEDTMESIAVYCLYRPSGTYNTVHPTSIPSPTYGTPMDTPAGFNTYLNANVTGASSIFTVSYRNTYTDATKYSSYSVFCLGYSTAAATIPVIAVYDVDIIPATDPNTGLTVGHYASVKRYLNGTITSYYDVIYRTGNSSDQFQPAVVAFERSSRLAVVEGATTIDRFKVAAQQPFYFIFWPDPSRDNLSLQYPNTASSLNASFANTDPRQTYNHMAGRTAFMFTVPMFPSS